MVYTTTQVRISNVRSHTVTVTQVVPQAVWRTYWEAVQDGMAALGTARNLRWWYLGNAALQLGFLAGASVPLVPIAVAAVFLVLAMHVQIQVNDDKLRALAERLLRGTRC